MHENTAAYLEFTMDYFGNFPINDFVLISQLGSGSFGSVASYQRKGNSDNIVAIKTCEYDKYFVRELKALHVEHRNIAEIKGWCLDPSASYVHIVLKLYKTDLYRFQKKHPGRCFNIEELKLLCPQLLSALAFLHSKNIAHRDMKPDNVLLDYTTTTPHENIQGVTLILTDFGLSRTVGDEASTSKYSVVGNKPFAAPEVRQMKNDLQVRARYEPLKSDVFSMGTVLFYMHKTKVPFEKTQLLDKNFTEKSSILTAEIQDAQFLQLLEDMLEWKPDDRLDIQKAHLQDFCQTPTGHAAMTKNK